MLLLDSLRRTGLKNLPRGVYSSWFLGACGRAGNWAFSLDIFDKVKSPRRQAILNQVAYECQRGRSWLQAISLLNEIRSRYVKSILTAFEKLGHDQMVRWLPFPLQVQNYTCRAAASALPLEKFCSKDILSKTAKSHLNLR